MICSRDWTYQNVLGALRARPNDQERLETVAGVLIELFGPDAECAICNLAVALRGLRDEEGFDATIYSKVRDAIWPAVSASAALLTFASEFAANDMTYAEVESEAIHDLLWGVIERSYEVTDEAAAVRIAFEIMADEAERNQPKED